MGVRSLNLNNYTICSEEDATLKITPVKLPNGVQPRVMYFKFVHKSEANLVASKLHSAVWKPTIKIDINQSVDGYKQCIHWWFKEATDEYKDLISKEYGKAYQGDKLSSEILALKNWILKNAGVKNKNGKWKSRKLAINKFMKTWLNRNVTFNFKE